MTTAAPASLEIRRWPTELPLLAVCVVLAAGIWVVLVVSIVGAVYALMFGLFFFVAHVAFVAHIRGSAVKLGPAQFPELHAAVDRLAARIGLEEVPDAYVMQAGGTLNAFAAKLFAGHLIVLYSDLLDACGDNTAARDMIIAHELGHVRAGHLRWMWFLFPAFMIPFLGTTLSRAREYTCDRFGLAGAGDPAGALVGLKILAAGAKRGPLVDTRAMLEQAEDLNTGWMTIGEWLSTHPPLLKRIAALDPALAPDGLPVGEGRIRATLIAAAFVLPVVVAIAIGLSRLPAFMREIRQEAARQQQQREGAGGAATPADPRQVVAADLQQLAAFLTVEMNAGHEVPADVDELYDRWQRYHPQQPVPRDPFDGERYGYHRDEQGVVLYSSGPDGRGGTEDDLWVRWTPPPRP